MEIAKIEFAAVEEAAAKGDKEIAELKDMELSLIGGGCGEVVLG